MGVHSLPLQFPSRVKRIFYCNASLTEFTIRCIKRTGVTRLGRAMAQAVSRRLLTAEARVRSRISPRGICGGQRGTGTDRFFPEYFGFPLSISFHRCSITRKNENKKLIIFITGLHNKPQGCGASVASAARHFSTNKTRLGHIGSNLGLWRLSWLKFNDFPLIYL
jgi:hypothetical protein